MTAVRLQKIMAQAGVGSRRFCETLIADGRVKVNGEVIVAMGRTFDPEADRIEVDGMPLTKEPHVYCVMNKPPGIVCTLDDDRGRPTVFDLVRDWPRRLFPVGRLDLDTSGLLILTNDGPFTQSTLHPSNKVFKRYEAVVEGFCRPATLASMENGMILERDAVPTLPCRMRRLAPDAGMGERWGRDDVRAFLNDPPKKWDLIEVWLREGRKRQIKRMFKQAGHPVLFLRRTHIGRLELKGVPLGSVRRMTDEEIAMAGRNPKFPE